ncbi:8816_t:CDS:1, partial [Ambispora leptoticha]
QKTPFTEHEKLAIISMYHQYGPSWTLIASNLPGRSALMVKNFWYNMDERVRIRVKMSIARLI